METASIPGNEAAAASTNDAIEQVVQSVETPGQSQTPAAPAPAEGDIRSELAAIRERLDQGFPAAEQPADLMAALSPQDLQFTPEEEAQLGQQGQQAPQGQEQQFADPNEAARMQAADDFVNQRVSAAIAPIVQERRVEQMEALGKQYPDIMDPKIFPSIAEKVQRQIERTGNDDLRFDADLVRMAYLATKAELADVGAVPAEQAATQGASIETQAGQSQTGDSSPSQDYVQALRGDTSTVKSVFE